MSKKQKRRDELMAMTAKQLVKGPATELGISGRWDMKKDELVEAILGAEFIGQKSGAATAQSAKDENKVENDNGADVAVKSEKQAASANMAQKMQYVESAEVGALVAFVLPTSAGKVKSAKITRKSSKNRKLRVETDYGAVYVISYEDVLWVRTGKRWPRGVYNLLKGIEGAGDDNENGDG